MYCSNLFVMTTFPSQDYACEHVLINGDRLSLHARVEVEHVAASIALEGLVAQVKEEVPQHLIGLAHHVLPVCRALVQQQVSGDLVELTPLRGDLAEAALPAEPPLVVGGAEAISPRVGEPKSRALVLGEGGVLEGAPSMTMRGSGAFGSAFQPSLSFLNDVEGHMERVYQRPRKCCAGDEARPTRPMSSGRVTSTMKAGSLACL